MENTHLVLFHRRGRVPVERLRLGGAGGDEVAESPLVVVEDQMQSKVVQVDRNELAHVFVRNFPEGG